MNWTIRIRAALQNTVGAALLLSLLWTAPFPGAAGELSTVPSVSPPDFSLPDLEGRTRGLGDFTGKVMLVTFWASWCSPCIKEIPSILRLSAAMADQRFTVIGINVGEGERRVQTSIKRLGLDFPVLLDRHSATFTEWGANVLPTGYVLDRNGRARYVAQGPLEWDRADIVAILKQLAAE